MWFHPDQFLKKRNNLETRVKVIKAIREFFDNEGFMEVETPTIQYTPCMDAHIHGFSTELISANRETKVTRYLHTSPEFDMKKLLVAGLQKIYQICRVFRNCEGSSRHAPEFTMIEWYRANAGYRDIMDDCVGLMRDVARAASVTEFKYDGMSADPFAKWEIITVCESFRKYADMDLESVLDDVNGFHSILDAKKIHYDKTDSWDDMFFRVFLEEIEPNLGQGTPTIIYDYPASMAALSRKKKDDPRFAERFEIYICGLELANAFGELTDAEEQDTRFRNQMDKKEAIYGERYPVDEEFINALRLGMPESGGIALGIDRLVMLVAGVDDIDDVLFIKGPRYAA